MGLLKSKFAFIIICCTQVSSAQVNLVITELKEAGQTLVIRYDIENYKTEDLFNVYVELITNDGNIIIPKNVEGDININVTGGKGYEIIWDLTADSIYMDKDVEIQLGADISVDISHFKYSSLLLSSSLLPGFGLKKIERKNAYLSISVLGYAALGISAYFYLQSQNYYNDYETETDPFNRSSLYDKTNEYRRNALISGISAAGIWLINYAWLTAKWNKKKKANASNKKFNFYGNYNPILKGPKFSIAYQF